MLGIRGPVRVIERKNHCSAPLPSGQSQQSSVEWVINFIVGLRQKGSVAGGIGEFAVHHGEVISIETYATVDSLCRP